MLCDKLLAIFEIISLWTASIDTNAFASLTAFVPPTLRTSSCGIDLHESGAVVVIVASWTLRIDFHSLASFATFYWVLGAKC